jgi:hypothetical protein
MKMKLSAALLALMFLSISTIQAKAQLPSIQDLTRNVNDAALDLEQKQNTFLGFKKLELPKSISNFVDVRLKRPSLPSLGILDKLKGIGAPKTGSETGSRGPLLAGLGKIFQPKAAATPSFIDRILGKSDFGSSGASTLDQADFNELSQMTSGLQKHVERISREAPTKATELFSGQATSSTPQPPLQSARAYSGQTSSRY